MARCWLLCVILAPAAAQELVGGATLALPHGELRWAAGEGWSLRYRGATVLLANRSELVLHDPKWTGQYANNANLKPAARLTRDGVRQLLSLDYRGEGWSATQELIAGPGDTVTVRWRYRQERWPDAQVQLGLPKPAESFFAGAGWSATAGQDQRQGVVPEAFKDRTLLSNVDSAVFHSLLGTVSVQSTRPLVLFDYPKRYGGFWLGYDAAVPVGQEQTVEITVRLAPAELTVDGVTVSDYTVTEAVTDGRLTVSLKARRQPGGPATLRLLLAARKGEAPAGEARAELALSEQPRRLAAELPLQHPGRYQVRIAFPLADGRDLLRPRTIAVQVPPALVVTPGRSVYLGDQPPELLLRVRPELAGRPLRLVAEAGELRAETEPEAGGLTRLPLLAGLPQGATEFRCRLLDGQRLVQETTAVVRRMPPKPGAVIIDYASRGLLVDGLPTLPFGFYIRRDVAQIATEEAPFGFTHVAPYRNSATFLTDDAKRAEMIAVLDRVAALGMKVHYDLRKIATEPESDTKWEALRREVSAVRDHPAILAWYLADEPELQNIPPERLAAAYRLVKELDPYHPCSQVFANRDQAPDYLDGLDILMTDPYPIPRGPVTAVADAAEQLTAAVGPGVPLWIVPQAFGGGEGWRREPSPAEERVMTYLALIGGATGIQYFIRDPAFVRPLPALLNACRDLAAEAAELSPALLSPLPRPKVACADSAIRVAGWRSDDALTVLAANTENRPKACRLTIAGAADGTAEVLFENREVAVAGGVIDEPIDAFGTRAYRLPLKAEDPTAGLAAGNLTENPSFERQHVPGSPDGYYLGGEPDPGAQVRIDSRVAYHGRHALRLVAPADGKGHQMSPFPVPLAAGRRYRVSLWAKSLQPGVTLVLSVGGLDAKPATFTLTESWQECALEGAAPKEERRGQIRYRLTTAGTAWIDLVQMVPLP